MTGQPDFAHLVIDYVPEATILESKSLKLYLGAFRNHGAFHEDCTLTIARAWSRRSAGWLRIAGYWYPRGGIPIDVFYQTGEPPAGLWLPDPASPPIAGGADAPHREPLSRHPAMRGRAPIREAIRERALAGFDAVGFAAAHLGAEARDGLGELSARGYHGDMGWLADTAARRGDPQTLWPEARSVVVLGSITARAKTRSRPRRSATRRDLGLCPRPRLPRHVKRRLKALARWIAARWPGELKVFVDTAPVMEKPLAEQAGLGWQGKHTNLVSRGFGSWLFLGEIYLSLALEPDAPETRPLRRLPPLPRCLSHRRLSRRPIGSMPALHLVSDDRAPGPDPARAAAADRQPHLRLRRLPRGLPVEQVRARHHRSRLSAARRTDGAAPGRTGGARRRRVPRAVRRHAGQAHRPRPVRPQRADRDRQRPLADRAGADRGGTAARLDDASPAGARRRGLGARPHRAGPCHRSAGTRRGAGTRIPAVRRGMAYPEAREGS